MNLLKTLRLLLNILIVLLLCSCAPSEQVPEFAVAVKLTPDAETRLKTLNESIIVAAYLDGDGMSEPGTNTAPFRNVYLARFNQEVNSMRVAQFKGKRVSGKDINRLSDKNYYVTINVFSARKAVNNNILKCDVPIERIENIKNKILEVHCDLFR